VKRWWLAAMLLLGSCDTREAMEARVRFEITRANGDIQAAERAAAAGGDPTYDCRAVRQMIAGLSSEQGESQSDVVARGRRICRKLTLDFARSRIAKLEAARPQVIPQTSKDKPFREKLSAECIELGRAIALARELVEPAPASGDAGAEVGDPEVAVLEAQRKHLCP